MVSSGAACDYLSSRNKKASLNFSGNILKHTVKIFFKVITCHPISNCTKAHFMLTSFLFLTKPVKLKNKYLNPGSWNRKGPKNFRHFSSVPDAIQLNGYHRKLFGFQGNGTCSNSKKWLRTFSAGSRVFVLLLIWSVVIGKPSGTLTTICKPKMEHLLTN